LGQDFHGAFSATTGANAPIYDQGWGEVDFDLHNCVQNWLDGGGTVDKISECQWQHDHRRSMHPF
jgi:chitinase